MKWINRGKEVIDKVACVTEEYGNRKGIYIFGAGFFGEEMSLVLQKYGIPFKYIDNDKGKQKSGYKGNEVISLQEYMGMCDKSWIVVTASEKNTNDISIQLEREGLKENIDFFRYRYFINDIFPIISLYCYNQLFVELTQICVTERCTLRCRKCAHACHKVPKSKEDMSLEFIKKSADSFFEKFDIVREFVLIGGEPFLCKDLKASIMYIGEKYRNKMIIFSITTNGTILLDDEILNLCRRYDVTIRVSDYSESLPRLKMRYDELYKKLKQNKVIIWETDREKSWFDYGFGEIDRGIEEDQLIETFDRCRTPCREIRGSKYYYCVMARSVSENLEMNIGKQDFIDLENIKNKQELMEFQMGYSDKGYLDMCRFCRGAEAENFLIPAAEQEERVTK